MEKQYIVADYKVVSDGYRLRVKLPNGDEVTGAEFKHDHPVFAIIIDELLEKYGEPVASTEN